MKLPYSGMMSLGELSRVYTAILHIICYNYVSKIFLKEKGKTSKAMQTDDKMNILPCKHIQ